MKIFKLACLVLWFWFWFTIRLTIATAFTFVMPIVVVILYLVNYDVDKFDKWYENWLMTGEIFRK